MGNVPDQLAVDGSDTEFQRNILGSLQQDIEFGTCLLDDVFGVVFIVPPQDDRVVRLCAVELPPNSFFRGVGEVCVACIQILCS
jgi:hypothetical protein